MNHGTNIEWTHVPGYKGETLNISTGCNKVSPGCKNCYAARDWQRLSTFPKSVYHGREFEDFQVHLDRFHKPWNWKKSRSIFVNSMSDIFHDKMSESHIYWFFNIMLECDRHIYMILTKRHERMQSIVTQMCEYFNLDELPRHIWIGVSCENQEMADERIPYLHETPASTRFLSCEPLLSNVNIEHEFLSKLDWVIAGGESGNKSKIRNCDTNWVRNLRDQCLLIDLPFFHKQNGGSRKINGAWGGRELDGRTWDEFPRYLNDFQFRCTVCGRIGSVGRCCGLNTREPLNDAVHISTGCNKTSHAKTEA